MRLYSTGSNSHGQLGHGNDADSSVFMPVRLPSTCSSVDSMAFGGRHTLLLSRGKLFVAGDNSRGQIGPCVGHDEGMKASQLTFVELPVEDLVHAAFKEASDLELKSSWTIKAIAAAWETSFVVLESLDGQRDDVLLVFGANDWDEWANALPAPDRHCGGVGIVKLAHLFDAEASNGPERLLIDSIQAGPRHVVVSLLLRTTNGRARQLLVGWGAARHGQLGVVERSPRTVAAPTQIQLPPGMDPSVLRLISCNIGRDHTALLFQQRGSEGFKIVLLGSSRLGQLGHESNSSNYNIISMNRKPPSRISLGTTWSGTFILESSGDFSSTLQGFSPNSHGQLARDPTLDCDEAAPVQISLTSKTIRKIACGSEHVLVIDHDHSAYGWGWNEHGNIGNGNTDDIFAPVRLGEALPGTIVDIWAGNATSWIVLEDQV